MDKTLRRKKSQNSLKSLTNSFVTPAGLYYTQTAYDDLGRVNLVTGPDAATSVLNYNIHLLNSQPASVTYSQDANGHWIQMFLPAMLNG